MFSKVLHGLIPKMPHDNCYSWLMGVGFCLLIFVSVITAFVSEAEAAQAAALNAVNILILTLFWWLRAFGQAMPPPTVTKFAAWFFSASILAVLTWSMATQAPLLVKMIFWVLAVLTSVGTSYFIFFSPPQPSDRNIRPLKVCFCFCLGFVLFNSFAVTYKTYEANIVTDQINSVIFEFASWLAAVLLFWCIAVMEITPHNSAIREWMKFSAWAFATMLAVMVVSKAAEIFPRPMKYVAWAMVAASSISCLYAFFLQHEAYHSVSRTLNEVHV